MYIFPFLLALLLVPLLELYLLIRVGGAIGAFPTVLLVVLTAIAGAVLMRHQGLRTLRSIQDQLRRGVMPAVSMLEGLFLLLAGALLLLPGFLTDVLGAALLVPALRRALAKSVLTRGLVRATGMRRRPPSGEPPRAPRTLEGEYRREDD